MEWVGYTFSLQESLKIHNGEAARPFFALPDALNGGQHPRRPQNRRRRHP